MRQLLMMRSAPHRSGCIHVRRPGPVECRAGTTTAAWAFVVTAATALLIADPASAEPAAAACFQMLPGQADVLPHAPLLLNTCTGEAFVLTRTKRAGTGSAPFAWMPIARPAAGRPDSARGAGAPTATGQANCFTYNGRSYCQ